MKRIELNTSNFKLLGRTLPFENGLLLSLSGTGIEFDHSEGRFGIGDSR